MSELHAFILVDKAVSSSVYLRRTRHSRYVVRSLPDRKATASCEQSKGYLALIVLF